MRARALASLLLLLLLATGCRRDAPARETLLIAGNAALARYLDPVVKEFQARHPGVRVVCEPGGTTASVIALKRGAIDVAALSRQVGAEEDDEHLRDYQVCRDGIAIILNPGNPVEDLTRAQLEDVFSGEITNWKALGGPDLPIVAYVRPKARAAATRSFNELVLGGDDPFPGAKAVKNTEEMIGAVKKEPGAIGSLALRRLSTEVKVARIEGVEMNRQTMLSGRYPLSRTFYLAVYLEPSKTAEDFVHFALSRAGQDLLAKDGLLPVR